MEIGEYDKVVAKATRREVDAETGEEDEIVDNVLLMRLMIDKVVDPKPPQEIVHVGARMYRAMSRSSTTCTSATSRSRSSVTGMSASDAEAKPTGND